MRDRTVPSGRTHGGAVLLVLLLIASSLSAGCTRAPSADASMQAGLDALYQDGDAATAATHFQAVLQRNPEHYGANYQLAVALDRSGHPDAARAIWEKVLSMAEGYADAETMETARRRLDQPAQDDGDQLALWMRAGLDLHYTRGETEEAIVAFRRVLEVNPDHYGANYQIAVALDAAGRRDEAEPHWRRVLVMAEGYADEETLAAARRRLGIN
jgi:tetratricopeptide (TPR) repeat protein